MFTLMSITIFSVLVYISISFNYNAIDIYHQPLFCNSEILISGKTILWNDFITAGITQLKDICYEVKTIKHDTLHLKI
jgi:hypothetical protein